MRKDSTLRASLLRWFDAHKRSLPWRGTRDPYRVWVSEIMLQQTRVETVIPYFTRFLERFPTLEALAGASEDDVMAHWSGLGYYRRARLLHAGVKEAVASHGGRVPKSAESRRKLPGVGRYTAGAIGSIAFDLEEPLVDGNVARVLSRLDGIEAAIGTKESEAALWARAEALVAGERPGDFNQALMELGATMCTPRAPRCGACPWKKDCVAQASGEPERLPVPRARKAPLSVALVAVAIVNSLDEIALVRGQGSLFGGLWSLPMREGDDVAAARALLAEHAPGAKLEPEPLGVVEHVLTHRRLSILLFRARAASRPPSPKSAASYFSETARKQLGRSSLTEKLVGLALPDQLSLPLRRRASAHSSSAAISSALPAPRASSKAKAPGRGSKS